MIRLEDYAKKEGISLQAAYKRLKTRGIKPKRGMIDEAQVAAVWNATRDEAQQRKQAPSPVPVPATNGKAPPLSKFAEARGTREQIKLEQDALDLAERKGMLTRAADVESAQLRVAGEARDHMMNFAGSYGASIAADLGIDARRVMTVIDKWMRRHLADLSQQFHEKKVA